MINVPLYPSAIILKDVKDVFRLLHTEKMKNVLDAAG